MTPPARHRPSPVATLHVNPAHDPLLDRLLGRVWVGVCPARAEADLPGAVGGLGCVAGCHLPDGAATAAMLDAYEAGGCPREVLADWVEDHALDPFAGAAVAAALRG